VLVIGGGIMGCASAWELARRGYEVTVLERSVPGAEASSSAAGILGAQIEAHGPGPMTELSLESRARYPRFVEELRRATGMDVGYRKCGVLRVDHGAAALRAFLRRIAWQRRARLDVAQLSARKLRRREPELSTKLAGGVLFSEDARVDPKALLRALHIAAERAGVKFRSGAYVRRVVISDGRARGVGLDDGSTLLAAHVIVAAGSWTSLIEGLPLEENRVVPARGQIVELLTSQPIVNSIVFGPNCYLVPRDDGRLLVGSTLEFVGYRREVTAGAVRDLLAAAIALAPNLAGAELRSSWSNFRPYTRDELPLLGPSPIQNLTFVTGHYRNGILLAPISAEIVGSVVRGKRPPLSLAAFSPARG
jgi:glycine oxidase